uniref:Uncharacterized protein n=1 Tax=Romanomermis culicivorax TaxID=13658 RepID=A0A915L0V0_ROMCU
MKRPPVISITVIMGPTIVTAKANEGDTADIMVPKALEHCSNSTPIKSVHKKADKVLQVTLASWPRNKMSKKIGINATIQSLKSYRNNAEYGRKAVLSQNEEKTTVDIHDTFLIVGSIQKSVVSLPILPTLFCFV